MGRIVYAHASDNVSPVSTGGGTAWVVNTGTGDADPRYQPTSLADLLPGLPAKLTTTTGSWVRDFGSAGRVDWVMLPHHNLTAGLEVRIQGNATNSWGTPTLNAAIVIPTYREDRLPVGSWLDLTVQAGYTVSGFRYWRLVVVGTNGAAVQVGEFPLLRVKRTLNPNIEWEAHTPEDRRDTYHETNHGVETVYDRGVSIRRLEGDLDTTDAGLAAVKSWWRDAPGRGRPVYIVPDEDLNEAYMARFQNTIDPTLVINDRNRMRLQWRECSRGLYL